SYANTDLVFAARAGVVLSANDNFDGGTGPGAGACVMDDPKNPGQMIPSGNCDDTNMVRIIHQDGTMAEYLHFAHHSLQVGEGWIIHRGDVLGPSGQVGDALNMHIHFDVQAHRPDGGGPIKKSDYDKSLKDPTSSIPVTFDEGDYPCSRPWNSPFYDMEMT